MLTVIAPLLLSLLTALVTTLLARRSRLQSLVSLVGAVAVLVFSTIFFALQRAPALIQGMRNGDFRI